MVDLAKEPPAEPQQVLPPAYGVPLRELLNEPGFAHAQILAGERGLDRLTTGVNVMEVPDVLDWVKPHELLVTSGFPFVAATTTSTPVSLPELLVELHSRGLAGMGIKLGRYLDEPPLAVSALADELGFPVIALPADLGFDDLLGDVYRVVSQRQAVVLQRIDALHTALSNLVLEGADLARIAEEIARVLDVGVFVTSPDGRERAATLPDGLRERLVAADLLDATGRVRVERVTVRPQPLADGEVRAVSVAAGGTDLARLVCASSRRRLGPVDVQALERSATVVALLYTQQQAVAAVENKYRGDFLRDVFLSRAGEDAYVIKHAATFGWDLDRPMVVVSAELDPADTDEHDAPESRRRVWQERFAAAWRQVCQSVDRSIPAVDFSTEIVALLPASEDQQELRALVGRVVDAVAGDRGGGRRPFSVGVSRVASGLPDLPATYNQARKAAVAGRRITGGRATTWFDDLGVHRVIALVPDHEELRRFADDVLGELASDTAETRDLRVTLQNLLDTNLNVAEAARLQFFHYNTMRYRLAKLEHLVGPFSSDPQLRLNVAVALQILELRA